MAELAKKVARSIGILLAKISKLQRYPNNDIKKQEIIQSQKKKFSERLPKIKENDLNHLYLMYDYTQNFASQINFYTEDNHYLKDNKDKIETVFNDIKIKKVSEY